MGVGNEGRVAVKSLLLVTPVFRRFDLTRMMLLKRVDTFAEAKAHGVTVGCVAVGDEENLGVAAECGFEVLEAPNVLGRKYNDGHQFAVENGWDISFQTNSDQVFDPRLLVAIANSPSDSLIQTHWLTAVHPLGRKALTYRNPLWSMKAYPRQLLEKNPRPCDDSLMRMCDTSVHDGVVAANGDLPVYSIETGPLETIQFESGFQVTPWKRNITVAWYTGTREHPVPWEGISLIHGEVFTSAVQEYYGV